MQDAGYRIQDARCRMQDAGCRMPGSRYRVPAIWHLGPGTRHRSRSDAEGQIPSTEDRAQLPGLHLASRIHSPVSRTRIIALWPYGRIAVLPYCLTALLPNCLLPGPDTETPTPVTAGGAPTRGSLPPWTASSRPAVARRPTGPGRRTQSPEAPFDTGGFFAQRRCSR